MRWFKHDSTAQNDAKLKKLRIKHGLEGYGLYWFILELICDSVDEHNLTFELEHDAEIIAHDTGIHRERVEEMMMYMCNLGLFENTEGVITCIKMAKRLDQSQTSNPNMRKLIKAVKAKNVDVFLVENEPDHDSSMIPSDESLIESCKIRLDKNINIKFEFSQEFKRWLDKLSSKEGLTMVEFYDSARAIYKKLGYAHGSRKHALDQLTKLSIDSKSFSPSNRDYRFLLEILITQAQIKQITIERTGTCENFPHLFRWIRDQRYTDDWIIPLEKPQRVDPNKPSPSSKKTWKAGRGFSDE